MGKIPESTPFKISGFVFRFRESSNKFVVEILTQNLAFNLSGALFFIGLGCSLKWWYKDQLVIALLKQNLPALSEPQQRLSWETGEYFIGEQTRQFCTPPPSLNPQGGLHPSFAQPRGAKGEGKRITKMGGQNNKIDKQNSEINAHRFHYLLERLDLYSNSVVVSFKSPWEKHAYHRYVGVFPELASEPALGNDENQFGKYTFWHAKLPSKNWFQVSARGLCILNGEYFLKPGIFTFLKEPIKRTFDFSLDTRCEIPQRVFANVVDFPSPPEGGRGRKKQHLGEIDKSSTSFITPSGLEADTFGVLKTTFIPSWGVEEIAKADGEASVNYPRSGSKDTDAEDTLPIDCFTSPPVDEKTLVIGGESGMWSKKRFTKNQAQSKGLLRFLRSDSTILNRGLAEINTILENQFLVEKLSYPLELTTTMSGWQPPVNTLVSSDYLDEIPYKLQGILLSLVCKEENKLVSKIAKPSSLVLNKKVTSWSNENETFSKKLQFIEMKELVKNELQILINSLPITFVDQSFGNRSYPHNKQTIEKEQALKDFENNLVDLGTQPEQAKFYTKFYKNEIDTENQQRASSSLETSLPKEWIQTPLTAGKIGDLVTKVDHKTTNGVKYAEESFIPSLKFLEGLSDKTASVSTPIDWIFWPLPLEERDNRSAALAPILPLKNQRLHLLPSYASINEIESRTKEDKEKADLNFQDNLRDDQNVDHAKIDSKDFSKRELLTPQTPSAGKGSMQSSPNSFSLLNNLGITFNSLGSLRVPPILLPINKDASFWMWNKQKTGKVPISSDNIANDATFRLDPRTLKWQVLLLEMEDFQNKKEKPTSAQRFKKSLNSLQEISLKQKTTSIQNIDEINLIDNEVNVANKKAKLMSGYVYPDTQSNYLKSDLHRWIQWKFFGFLRELLTPPGSTQNGIKVFYKKESTNHAIQQDWSSGCEMFHLVHDAPDYITNDKNKNQLADVAIPYPSGRKNSLIYPKIFRGLSRLMDKACLASVEIPLIPRASQSTTPVHALGLGVLKSTSRQGFAKQDSQEHVKFGISGPLWQNAQRAAFPILQNKRNTIAKKFRSIKSSENALSLLRTQKPQHQVDDTNNQSETFDNFVDDTCLTPFLSTPFKLSDFLTPFGGSKITQPFQAQNKKDLQLSKEETNSWKIDNHLAFFPGFIKPNKFLSSLTQIAQGNSVFEDLIQGNSKEHNATQNKKNKFIIDCSPRKIAYRGIVAQRDGVTKDFQSPTKVLKLRSILGTALFGPENPLTDRQSHFFGQKRLSTIDTNDFQRDYLRQLGKETLAQSNPKGLVERATSVERVKILSFSKAINSFSLKKRKYTYLLEKNDEWHLLFQEQLRNALEDTRKYPPLTLEQAKDHGPDRIKVSAPLMMARFPKRRHSYKVLAQRAEGKEDHNRLESISLQSISEFDEQKYDNEFLLPKIICHYPLFTETSSSQLNSIPWLQKNSLSFFNNYKWFTQEPLNINSWSIISQWSFLVALLFWIEQIFLGNICPALSSLEQVLLGATGIRSSDRTHVIRVSKGDVPKFQHIAGVDGLLGELAELVLFLRGHKERLWNKKSSCGVLLTGPPGTGKTFLVRALANEAKVPVFILSAGTLTTNKTNGSKPSWAIRHAFRRAKQLAPCILFIDEIDALGRSRGKVATDINEIVADTNVNKNHTDISITPLLGSTLLQAAHPVQGISKEKSYDPLTPEEGLRGKEIDHFSLHEDQTSYVMKNGEAVEKNKTVGGKTQSNSKENAKGKFGPLTQLLVSMDGVSNLSGVLIMGATNRPESLDPALTRPGRFERIIRVEKPAEQKRIEILQLYSRNLGIQQQIPWSYLANRTVGLTAADLAVAMNYSSLKAIVQESVHTIETIEYGLDSITRFSSTSSMKHKTNKSLSSSNEIDHFSMEYSTSFPSPPNPLTAEGLRGGLKESKRGKRTNKEGGECLFHRK